MKNLLRLCVWCAGFVLGEVGMFLMYRHHDARFHWFAHFFTGAAAALLIMSVVAWRQQRPVKAPLLWIFAGHLYAGFPDLLFLLFGMIHRMWMDVFLGHISVHFTPGRNWTLYGVFVVCLAVYLRALAAIEAKSETWS